MKLKEYTLRKVKNTEIGSKLIDDKQYRFVAKAVLSLVFNLIFAVYYGIIGVISLSIIFAASSVYYLLLAVMRFSAVMINRKEKVGDGRQISSTIGILLIILSVIFHIIVLVSIKYQTAVSHDTITMIAIATFTSVKIVAAAVSAVKQKNERSSFIRAISAIRYSEIAVSLLAMQQSMLESFGDSSDGSSVILNACTGAGVCFFILLLGIITLKDSRRA